MGVIKKGLIKQPQIEKYNQERVEQSFEDKSIPESKLILDDLNAKIDSLAGGTIAQQVVPVDTSMATLRIKHGLNKKPTIKVLADNKDNVITRIIYEDDNTIEVIFEKRMNGQVIIN